MSTPASNSDADVQDAAPKQKLDFNEVAELAMDKPCHVEAIRVTEQPAPLRTKDQLYRADLERIHEATTLSDIIERIQAANDKWNTLGVFKRVVFHLDESANGDPEGVTVHVLLEERKAFWGNVGTYVQGGEGSVEAQAGLRNPTGHAEQLTARVEYGSQHSNTYATTYRHPFLAGLPGIAELKLQKYFKNHQELSSYTQHLLSAGASLSSVDGRHQVGYEVGWRRLVDPTALASRSVLQHAGEYLLSTLNYTYLVDRRDNPAMTREGWAFRSQSSVTGLGQGAKPQHVRQQLDWTWASPMSDSASFVFSGALGVLLPYGTAATTRPTCICDRFFLGGPSTLRGFQLAGAGPTDVRRPPPRRPTNGTSASSSTPPAPGRDALGGDLYTSVMASVIFDMPSAALRALNIHGHGFINGGNVVPLSGRGAGGGGLQGGLQEFSNTFRWSAGVGLVFPTPFGRMELNAVRVLTQQQHDRAKHGVQFGFCASALM